MERTNEGLRLASKLDTKEECFSYIESRTWQHATPEIWEVEIEKVNSFVPAYRELSRKKIWD